MSEADESRAIHPTGEEQGEPLEYRRQRPVGIPGRGWLSTSWLRSGRLHSQEPHVAPPSTLRIAFVHKQTGEIHGGIHLDLQLPLDELTETPPGRSIESAADLDFLVALI